MTRYIFLRIAWMKEYQGSTDDDIPTGAGSYVKLNQDGGEVYNFLPIKGSFYGFAQIHKGNNLRIEKLGAASDEELVDNITIIWFARNPQTGGQYIVGWYKKATLYRQVQQMQKRLRKEHNYFLAKADIKNSYLVPVEDRFFEVPPDGAGQTNAWYVEYYHQHRYLQEVIEYIANPKHYIIRRRKKRRGKKPWQLDAELRKKIEMAAMDAIQEYFEDRNYSVKYVHTENVGWDMEATLRKQTLLLEVKGLSGDFRCVDFTPNEYTNSKTNRKLYRICVVSNVLNIVNRKLDIFYFENKQWISNENISLTAKEVISARFFKND